MSTSRLILILAFAVLVIASPVLIPIGRMFVEETRSRVRQRPLHEQTFQTVLRPATDWVRTFRDREKRLPTEAEFTRYAQQRFPGISVGVYDSQIPWMRDRGCRDLDFMVWAHVSDWTLYRQSWDMREWKVWTD
jgi:hypothetical protein